MMEKVLIEDQEIRDDNGNLICRVARDVFAGEYPSLSQFKDWTGGRPAAGDVVHPAISKAAGGLY